MQEKEREGKRSGCEMGRYTLQAQDSVTTLPIGLAVVCASQPGNPTTARPFIRIVTHEKSRVSPLSRSFGNVGASGTLLWQHLVRRSPLTVQKMPDRPGASKRSIRPTKAGKPVALHCTEDAVTDLLYLYAP